MTQNDDRYMYIMQALNWDIEVYMQVDNIEEEID
jgi:hypothetical protein